MHIRIAFRNLLRNRIRSLITIGAVAFGCAALIIAGGFIEDMFVQLRENYIKSFLGHLQIYRNGYIENGVARPFDFMISDPGGVMKKISAVQGVRSVAPRIEFSGLLSTGDTTVSFIGQGIDPGPEREISSFVQLDAGKALDAEDRYSIILGRGLSGALDAKPGSSLVLVANTKGGSINALDVTVKGVFYTMSKAFDDRALRMPVSTAQRLLQTGDVQTLVVLLDRTEDTDAAKKKIEEILRREGLGLEVRPWYEMADFYNKTVKLFNRQFLVLKLIIAIVVVLGVFNTMNMSIIERTGEVGTVMALGMKRKGVLAIFLCEGLLIGVFGGLLGILGGVLLAKTISQIGIPMPPPPGATIPWTASIRVVPGVLGFSFLLSMAASAASSCYPAFRASRLEIAEALRRNI